MQYSQVIHIAHFVGSPGADGELSGIFNVGATEKYLELDSTLNTTQLVVFVRPCSSVMLG